MAELALTDVYGASATQNSTTVTFTKSELDGLIPAATNPTDSITVAILNQWKDIYTAAARAADPDISIVATFQPIPQVQGVFPPAPAPAQAYDVYTYSIQVFVARSVTPPSPGDVG